VAITSGRVSFLEWFQMTVLTKSESDAQNLRENTGGLQLLEDMARELLAEFEATDDDELIGCS
jgi:hypothetical protein